MPDGAWRDPGPARADRVPVGRAQRRALRRLDIGPQATAAFNMLGVERGLDHLFLQHGGVGAWPVIVEAIERAGAPPDLLRDVLADVWLRGHRDLVDFVRDRARLAQIFRAASFPPPIHLPDLVTVWRGGAGLSAEALSAGLSWSTRRSVAAHFAIQHAGASIGRPLVVRRIVPRSAVAWWTDIEGTAEAVVVEPAIGEVDGDEAAWTDEAAAEADRQIAFARDLLHRAVDAADRGDPPPGPRWLLRRADDLAHAYRDAAPLVPALPPGEVMPPTPSIVTPALVATVMAQYRLPLQGIHGPAHWMRVAANGAALAARTADADAAVVEAFALIHDARRQSEGGDDPEHGPRAATFARDLAASGVLPLDSEHLAMLAAACERHEAGKVTRHPTIAACWDADRLELARLGIRPRPALLSTAAVRDSDLLTMAWRRGVLRQTPAALAAAWGLPLWQGAPS